MIDPVQFRIQIGTFIGKGGKHRGKGKSPGNYADSSAFNPYNMPFSIKFYNLDTNSGIWNENLISSLSKDIKTTFLLFFYFYFMIFLSFCMISVTSMLNHSFNYQWIYISFDLNCKLSFVSLTHIKVGYFCLMSSLVIKYSSTCNSQIRIPRINHSRLSKIISLLILYILLLNFLLIAIVNPRLLNPGPNNLKVCYQNVRGLIPFSELSKNQPSLDKTKIFELNAYIHQNRPDVIMFNETWLKKSINDNDVIFDNTYSIFRNDRSQVSHPPDTSNPNKFRKFGGGVMIAVRSDLQASFKRLPARKGAEIVAIEININGKMFVLCSVYRVGTLGEANHDSIMNTIKTFYKVRNPRKIFIVGDFNLSSVSWPDSEDSSSVDVVEKSFIDSFNEFGLHQCIIEPTHSKGRTLDLLLTNNKNALSNIQVIPDDHICTSDHFPLTFEIKTNVVHNASKKRKILNFKKANWDALNRDLLSIPWTDVLDGREPELAWRDFKCIVNALTKKHIPTITIRSDFTLPWFDSECFEAYRDKKRAHKQYRLSKNKDNEIKFKSKRRTFKAVCSKKMKENLFNEEDTDIITKKCWSHVKANSKSTRLPETIHLEGRFRNDPVDKAELFNCYFYDQFSGPSNYNIAIDWSNDSTFDINFSENKICQIFLNINPNKACGPDEIHGQLLKNCAHGMAGPVSILFKLSYNTGCIPTDWKMAHVVSVHKKGSKDDVENYRPISLTSLIMKSFEKIVKENLLFRTAHLLDKRQHGFLASKSCTTNMIEFTDNIVLSINDAQTLSTDVIYFDFSKAFDSVNHDIILYKLKHIYSIDGRILKFLKNYLCGREQCVVLDGCKSSTKPVLSGVPQGSILGPILFVLFINDLPQGLHSDTNLALYADDTKIWRTIKNDDDIEKLQLDINYLNRWSEINKMNFHSENVKFYP